MDNESYLESVRAHLDEAGFQLEATRSGTTLKARRREVKLSRFGLVETVVEVSTLQAQPTPDDLRAFGDAAVRSALEGKSRIPRGLGSSLVVYPALVAEGISDGLARFAESYAPKHFSIMEFPLVIDPAVRRLVMLDKTPFWGAAYYRKTRQDAQELLAPPLTGAGPRAAAVDDGVVVKVVSGEPEAELVIGLLRAAGIGCGYRDTEAIDSPLEDFTAFGPREILVHEKDLEAARALLVEDES